MFFWLCINFKICALQYHSKVSYHLSSRFSREDSRWRTTPDKTVGCLSACPEYSFSGCWNRFVDRVHYFIPVYSTANFLLYKTVGNLLTICCRQLTSSRFRELFFKITAKWVRDTTETPRTGPQQESSTRNGKLSVRDQEIPKKQVACESLDVLRRGEPSFWASENYTRRVHSESNSPE